MDVLLTIYPKKMFVGVLPVTRLVALPNRVSGYSEELKRWDLRRGSPSCISESRQECADMEGLPMIRYEYCYNVSFF